MLDKKLDKYSKIIYICILFFVVGLIVFIATNFNTNRFSTPNDKDVIHYNEWELYDENGNYISSYESLDVDIAADETVVLKATLPNDLPHDYCLGFHSSHSDVHIYADGQIIFSFYKGDNPFGNTSGYGYHMIHDIYEYEDQIIEISLSSPYGIATLPQIELGSSSALFFHQLALSSIPFALSIVTLFIGLLIVAYGIYTIVRANVNRSFIFLGLFTMTLGFYTSNEQTIMLILTGNNVYSAYASFYALMLMPIPFVFFVKELYTNKDHLCWYVIVFINFANLTIQTLLQVLNIIDLKNMLWITHAIYAVTICTAIALTIYEVIKHKVTTSLKLNIICIFVIATFLFADIFFYYTVDYYEPSILGTIGFLIYIFVVGCHSIHENTSLLVKGRQAEQYKTLAYIDNLTKIGNRTAHDAYLKEADLEKHSYIIGMFDLNDLKYHNDTFGHEIGDKYIVSSAMIIKEAFGELSNDNCYRIGGDEFCVILEDKSVNDFLMAYEKLNYLINEFNLTSDELSIHIAVGYAQYDPKTDHDLKETRSRADAMMYKNKFMMKEQLSAK